MQLTTKTSITKVKAISFTINIEGLCTIRLPSVSFTLVGLGCKFFSQFSFEFPFFFSNLSIFTFRIIYLPLHKYFFNFLHQLSQKYCVFLKGLYMLCFPFVILFLVVSFFLKYTLHRRVSKKSLVNFCPMKNSRACDWKTYVHGKSSEHAWDSTTTF